VWIDFFQSHINVTMALAGMERPRRPLISEFVNLSTVLLDDMCHVCGVWRSNRAIG
jgi:hypothetical protein